MDELAALARTVSIVQRINNGGRDPHGESKKAPKRALKRRSSFSEMSQAANEGLSTKPKEAVISEDLRER